MTVREEPRESKQSFRHLLKAFTVLGGSQAINLVIAIARTKIIAVLLGPFGVGVAGLFQSSISLIRNLTDFGLNISAVKDVSVAEGSGNTQKIGTVVSLVRILVWGTGILGLVLTVGLSKQLSIYAFGSTDYTISFILLSLILLVNQINVGEIVVLQGLSKLKLIAKSQIIGSFISFVVVVPLYVILGVDGIVPALIITALITLFVTRFFSRKVEILKVRVSKKVLLGDGARILRLGFLLSLSILLSKFVEYLIRIYITNNGEISDVGLYNAGFAIVNTYVAVFFSTIISDFYPRLSAKRDDFMGMNRIINDQTSLLFLIVSPVLILCLIVTKYIVLVLYTKEFLEIVPLVHWLIIAMYFKISGWLLGYQVLAKDDSKVFFTTQVLKNIFEISLSVFCYYKWGLVGLGISFLGTLFLTYVLSLSISKIRYKFSYDRDVLMIILVQVFLGCVTYCAVSFLPPILNSLIVGTTLVISASFSYYHLNKKINIRMLIKQSIERLRK